MQSIITEEMKIRALALVQDYAVEGFMKGQGSLRPKCVFVGEAPGETEVVSGKPFSGRAGKKFDANLERIGLTRENIFVTSVFRSRPFKVVNKMDRKTNEIVEKRPNRKPVQKEIDAHAWLLDEELKRLDPSLVIVMGNVALKRVLGDGYSLKEARGKIFKEKILIWNNGNLPKYIRSEKEYSLLVTYHPAAVLYNPSLNEEIKGDFQRISEYLTKNMVN
ncbi:uracil-DNA glycosylase [Lacticigenium naphthae]|uniref:uracil-DNA glycosylase n=1 Tax=Lacticigenium naphthae TaxID=515351 RepID=UPI00040C80AC|nr:uracil-DNA glycosylase [Lacticigenium naphthae]